MNWLINSKKKYLKRKINQKKLNFQLCYQLVEEFDRNKLRLA